MQSKTYSNKDFQLLAVNFFIDNSLYEKSKSIAKKDKRFKKDIFYSIMNLKEEERQFPVNNFWRFYNKYFYSMNFLLHSLNAYLLNQFIMFNKHNTIDKNWEDIYKQGNWQNKLTYLFFYMIENKKIKTYDNLLILAKLNIYENLFRHQLSHGWFEIFLRITREDLENLQINAKTSLNKKGDNNSLDQFRECTKKRIEVSDYLISQGQDYSCEMRYREILNGVDMKIEPMVEVSINIEQLNKELICNESFEHTVLGIEDKIFQFSLNILIEDILKIQTILSK